MTLQGCRDLRVLGPKLGCQYFVVWALSQAGEEVGIWELQAPGRDPSPAEALRFPPVTITGLCAVCMCRPGWEGKLVPLVKGWGPPAAWEQVGFHPQLGDGAAGGWHQGFIN